MSQQNFVEQFRLFMEYARKNSMHSRECMLWVSLFYFANEEATYNAYTQTYEWPDDFFEVSNGELNAYGKFDKQAVETLRNRLKQRGLIDFIKGNRNSATPMYKIHYLYKSGNKIIPNNTANDTPNQQANHIPNNTANDTPNQQANRVPNHTPLYININNKPCQDTNPNYIDDEEEQEEEQQRAYARVSEEILDAWKRAFGERPKPLIVNELARRGVMLGFEEGVLAAAIRTAAWRNANSPMDFITTTLADWKQHNIKTTEDVDEYSALYDMQNGRFGVTASWDAGDKIKAFTEDRASPENSAMR